MTRWPPIAKCLVQDWLAQECEIGPANHERAGVLWDSWRVFARTRHDAPGTPAEFAATMDLRPTCRNAQHGIVRRL